MSASVTAPQNYQTVVLNALLDHIISCSFEWQALHLDNAITSKP